MADFVKSEGALLRWEDRSTLSVERYTKEGKWVPYNPRLVEESGVPNTEAASPDALLDWNLGTPLTDTQAWEMMNKMTGNEEALSPPFRS